MNATKEAKAVLTIEEVVYDIGNTVYGASVLLEKRESKELSGNGHHGMQNVCKFARMQAVARWMDQAAADAFAQEAWKMTQAQVRDLVYTIDRI